MTDQLNTIGSPKPLLNSQHEQPAKHHSEVQSSEKKLLSGEDKISLDQSKKSEPTYGPM